MLRRGVRLLGLLSLICMVAGCTADRTGEANRVRDAVASMPGVRSVYMSYVNDFENGPNFWLTLDMSQAGIEEIASVAARIRDTMGDDFDSHRQKFRFDVAPGGAVERRSYGSADPRADLNPERIGADARVVRNLIALSGRATWLRDTNIGSRLTFAESPDPDAVVAGALPLLMNEAVTVKAPASRPVQRNGWELTMPLTDAQWRDITRLRDGMPVQVFSISVVDGKVSGLNIELPVLPSAAADLTKTIDAVGPSREHPLAISWQLDQQQAPSLPRSGEARLCGRSNSPSTNYDPAQLQEYVTQTYELCPA